MNVSSTNVLITGGSGLIGKRLTQMLLGRGYSVSHLSRRKANKPGISVYEWDYKKDYIEDGAIANADYIIHLAGASVAGKRWTKNYKKEIVDSRVKTTELLLSGMQNTANHVKGFFSASAIGIYGDRGDEKLTETSASSSGFMADTVIQWENAVDKIRQAGYRTTSNRIGLVLAPNGGVLEEMTKSFKFGVAGYFGSGNQYYPWVHAEDVCRLFLYQLENENVSGIFNACSPNPVSMKALLKAVMKARKSRALLLPIPQFVLKIMVGEMSDVITHSQRVIPEATLASGFEFQYADIKSALAHIYGVDS